MIVAAVQFTEVYMNKERIAIASLPSQQGVSYATQPCPWSAADKTRISVATLAREQGVSYATARRWSTVGLFGLLLPVFFIGGRRYTYRENFATWNEQVNAVRSGQSVVAAAK